MNFLLFTLIFNKVTCFSHFIKPRLHKYTILKNSLYEIYPINTIIYYKLNETQKMNIQNEFNNERFSMNNDNIYISLHDVKQSDRKITRFQIFLYVHDKTNNLNGQYILESKDYQIFNRNNLVCSFYESNPKYFCSLSYYQYNLDYMNFNSEFFFDFIYKNDAEPYLKNVGVNNKISYIPYYLYTSEFKYKDMTWEKSDKVIYYKESFYYIQ
jgi:hypothetical protein